MNDDVAAEITQILHEWNNGSANAREKLFPYVYDQLKRQARGLMSRERGDHTLQPTALVHEAFLRIAKETGIDWQDRHHFYGITARLMRQILIDHARAHAARKRGGDLIQFSMEDFHVPVTDRAVSILALDEALDRLAQLDEQQAKVVEMRFFGGMTIREIAANLDISERTVSRDWETAKYWLYRELKRSIP